MNTLDTILKRRSYRKYTGEVISDEQIMTILKAGFAAPSAHNYQPWEFIVVKEQEQLQKIAEVKNKMVLDAGTLFVICGDLNRQERIEFITQDTSAVTQNMLLAAEALDLGAVWLSCHPRENVVKVVKETFNLPEHIVPISMIIVGHKNEEKDILDKFDENKIHYDRW